MFLSVCWSEGACRFWRFCVLRERPARDSLATAGAQELVWKDQSKDSRRGNGKRGPTLMSVVDAPRGCQRRTADDGGRRTEGGGLAHGTHGTHGRIFYRRERRERWAAGRRTERPARPKPTGWKARATWHGLSSPCRGDRGSPVVACRVEPPAERTARPKPTGWKARATWGRGGGLTLFLKDLPVL